MMHRYLSLAVESAAIFRSLVTLSLLLTLLTVVLSAYIRLAEVGVGCDGWPDCYAQLNPAVEKKGITVLTAQGAGCAPYEHAITQLPYALLAAGISAVGFLLIAL